MNTILQDPLTLGLLAVTLIIFTALIAVKVFKKVDTIEDDDEDFLMPVEPWYRDVTDPVFKSVVREVDKYEARKQAPIFSGVLYYFPDAMWEIARCSEAGNRQHHPDKPLHWDMNKSTDEPDALLRHLMQYDQLDEDNVLHAAKAAWRANALLQRVLIERGEAPIYESRQNRETPQ